MLLFVGGCAQTRPASVRRTCTNIFIYAHELETCKKLALAGNPEAAMRVGDEYSGFDGYSGRFSMIVRRDGREAISWYTRAADLGFLPAMRKLFDAYLYGSAVPKNVISQNLSPRVSQNLSSTLRAGRCSLLTAS